VLKESPKEEVSLRDEAKTQGENSSKGKKAERGPTDGIRVKPSRRERNFLMHKTLSQMSLSDD
jgi:hypothetical protein